MIDQILSNELLTVVFQPIVDLHTGEARGYEALGRVGGGIPDAPLGPAELIELAAREHRLLDVDRQFRRVAIERIAREHAEDDSVFFLNVDTRIVNEPGFTTGFTHGLLERHGLSPARFVLELGERDSRLDSGRLAQMTRHYANQGFGIALDDVGQGYASLAAVIRLRPQVVKLDREIIQGLAKDPVREHLVRALADFTRRSAIELIAEGIETSDELLALVRAGVRFGQGYLLGRPANTATAPSSEVRSLIRWAGQEALATGAPSLDVEWPEAVSRFLAG